MRIVVHDYAGHPFQVQLSRWLARRGHVVRHLYFGSNWTPKGPLVKRSEDPVNFAVAGIYLAESFKKYSLCKRRFQEIEYGALLADEIDKFCPQVVISANTPLDTQKIILNKCQTLNIKFICWVQDITGVATYKILKRKVPILGRFIGHYYMRLERQLLNRSDAIVVITEDFLPLLRSWNVKEAKVHTIQNWAPLDEIKILPKSNSWSHEHSLADKFCILYSGTLGFKHNPDLLLRLAVHFKDSKNIRIVVVSEGLGAEWLKNERDKLGLNNLILIAFQPFAQLSHVLASADILVAILEADAGVFSVPSKVLTYMCAGRPMVLAVPKENLAAKIISRNHAGLVVDPGDVSAFISAVETLASDGSLPETLSHNALSYARNTFDIERIGSQFEKVILGQAWSDEGSLSHERLV